MKSVHRLCAAGLLIAIGLIIPLFSPIRFYLEPASFTLASHVAIFIAMFLSPGIAVAVAVGTTIGFLFSSTIVIAMRAATHLIFATVGALYLQKNPGVLENPIRTRLFSFIIGIIHGAAEVLVVCPFFFGGNMAPGFYDRGFLLGVVILVGFGSLVHSMVDFEIAFMVNKVLHQQKGYAALQTR